MTVGKSLQLKKAKWKVLYSKRRRYSKNLAATLGKTIRTKSISLAYLSGRSNAQRSGYLIQKKVKDLDAELDEEEEESEQESEMESEDDMEEGESEFEEKCPIDCESLLWTQVLELREKKLDQEEILADIQKVMEV